MIARSPADFRTLAKRRLPRFLFDYLDGAAQSEGTAARNLSDLADIRLRQRVLQDVSRIDLSTRLFGMHQSMPIGLGPVGIAGLYARRGEVQAARAARAAAIPFALSTVSLCSLSEVVRDSGVPPWFQLYVIRDRGFMKELLAEARSQGCPGLFFTVDMPAPGIRYRDAYSGMSGRNAAARRAIQALTHPRWLWDVGIRGRPHVLGNVAPVLKRGSGLEDFMGWLGANFDPSIAWRDIAWLREQWDGPLVIKGILDAADALQAEALGADGIVVSNHGGRQLDGAPSTAEALPHITKAVSGRIVVLADSGIRSGVDVLRMLALGADGVLLGRAWVYALAAAGEAGVTRLLTFLESELRVAMALTGCVSVASIHDGLLYDTIKGEDDA